MYTEKKNAYYYYDETQKLIDKHTVKGGVDWFGIFNDLFNRDNPVISEQELNNASADYRKDHLENSAWKTSLYFMSWILYNFKMKTQDGHCQSTFHGHPIDKPKCSKGSEFHNKLYTKCFSSFKEILEELEKDPSRQIV